MATDNLITEPGDFGRRDIVAGMAHFPGGGPAGKQCGDCKHYGAGGLGHGRGCSEFVRMTHAEAIPFSAFEPACKYFAQAPEQKSKLW